MNNTFYVRTELYVLTASGSVEEWSHLGNLILICQ